MTRTDYGRNTAEAVLKAVPYIGESLCQFIFGPSAERRMRRIERTLTEVAQTLKDRNIQPNVESEDFVNLLEVAVPKIAKATNEDVRKRFRDLLLNCAALESGSSDWQNAELVAAILDSVAPPGLAIIAALAKCPEAATVDFGKSPVPDVQLVSLPRPQIVVGEFDYDNPINGTLSLPYDWEVLAEWAYRLKDKRLIHFHSSHARGGFGNIYLSTLGQFLVRWAIDTEPVRKAAT